MTDVIVRRAEAGDAEAIAAVIRAAFAEFRPLYTPDGFRATTPDARGVVSRMAEGPVWIALDGSRVVGTAAAVDRTSEVYLRGMAVHPSARGAGIATTLLRVVTEFAIDRGVALLTLSTTPFLSAAIALYERHGFRPTDDPMDLCGTRLIRMVKPLAIRRTPPPGS